MGRIAVSAKSSGSPAEVWRLLADASCWTRWGAWSSVEVEGGAEHGPGSVRVLVRGRFRVRERVTDWVPGERMGYELLDGMRVRGYRAEVTLEPAAAHGTIVRWRSRYDRAGWPTAVLLRLAVRDACRRVAKAASG
jgi:Polyketide cyclase / dehydrase and lipid transport